MLQTIAGQAVMVQSYLVSEEDNKRLNSDSASIELLVNLLKSATHGRKSKEPGLVFDDVEVIQVQSASNRTRQLLLTKHCKPTLKNSKWL